MHVSHSLSQQHRSAIDRMTECVDRANVAALQTLSREADLPADLVPVIRRVEQLVSEHEQILDNARSISVGINHDLRTPLHVLILQTEVSLRSPRSATEYETLLRSNLEEFERLATALNELLRKLQTLGRPAQAVAPTCK